MSLAPQPQADSLHLAVALDGAGWHPAAWREPGARADLLLDWREAGLTGFRLRPAALPHDLAQITSALVLELQRRGAFRTAYPDVGNQDHGHPGTLRALLGLPRPANRYAPA